MKFLWILLICSKIVSIICTGGKDKRKLEEYEKNNTSTSNEFGQKSTIKKPKAFDLNELPAADDDDVDSFNDENIQHSSSSTQHNPMHNIQQSIAAECSSNPTAADDHINHSQNEPRMIVNSSSIAIEPEYIDFRGKSWTFQEKVGKNIPHEKLLTKFGFTVHQDNTDTLNLHCQMRNPAGGRCPLAGIYVKSNGYLYTRGEHEHTKRGKTPQNVGDDYVDRLGNIWKFHSKFGEHIPDDELWYNKFKFSSIQRRQKTLNLYCQRRTNNGKQCPFAGIYLKQNGCLYMRGEHEHKNN